MIYPSRLDVALRTIATLEAERDRLLASIGAALAVRGSAGEYRRRVHAALTEGFDTKTKLFLGDELTVERLSAMADSVDPANYPDDEDAGIARRL